MPAVLNIQNQIYLALDIQGESMPDATNLVSIISINESVAAMTPTMQFTFDDPSNSVVRKLAMTEGTKIKIVLGRYQDKAITRNFRLFGFKQQATRTGPKLIGNFIYDSPQYITGSYTEGHKETSSKAIAKIASECGLEPKVVDTNDEMVWLNLGQTRAAFTEDIASHGYVDESSCMMRALTSQGVLLYRDVMDDLNSKEPVAKFKLNSRDSDSNSSSSETEFNVRDIRNVSTSGVMNNWLNYGWKYAEHSLSGDENLHENYKAKTKEKYLPINSEIKGSVTKSKLDYSPKLDCRNVHKNYAKAFYNNTRGRALLSEKLHVLIEEPTKVQLLDVVEFKHTETDGNDGKDSGNYIVTSKVVYVNGGSAYYEKFEICRCSLREAGNTPLMG